MAQGRCHVDVIMSTAFRRAAFHLRRPLAAAAGAQGSGHAAVAKPRRLRDDDGWPRSLLLLTELRYTYPGETCRRVERWLKPSRTTDLMIALAACAIVAVVSLLIEPTGSPTK